MAAQRLLAVPNCAGGWFVSVEVFRHFMLTGKQTLITANFRVCNCRNVGVRVRRWRAMRPVDIGYMLRSDNTFRADTG